MAEQAQQLRRRRRSRYDVQPRWISWKKVISLFAIALVGSGVVYGGVIVAKIANLTGGNPLSIVQRLTQALPGGGDRVPDSFPRTTVALFGYGGGNHDGAYLSDSILVLTMQKKAGRPIQAAEISVPRDWFVPIDMGNDKKTYGRINQAYSDGRAGDPDKSDVYVGPKGGGQMASHELETLLGLHIDHWVGVDFHAFQALVDAVGGVDVDVPNKFTDREYPAGDCVEGDRTSNCGFWTVRFNKGAQHMDGATALVFARSRHSQDNNEGTDFARGRRQQLILQALKQKLHSADVLREAPRLLDAVGDHTVTDMTFDEETRLYDEAKGLDQKSITHISIDDTNFLYRCMDVQRYCPADYYYAFDKSYKSLQHYIDNVLPDPDALAEKAAINVVDASGYGETAATRWTSLLTQVGFHATDGGSARRTDTTQVIDTTGGRGARTARWLATYYGVEVTTPTPDASSEAGSSPSASAASPGTVTVILGRDEERAFNATSPNYERSGSGGYSSGFGNSGNNFNNYQSRGYATATPRRYYTSPTRAPSYAPAPTKPPVVSTPCGPPACKPSG